MVFENGFTFSVDGLQKVSHGLLRFVGAHEERPFEKGKVCPLVLHGWNVVGGSWLVLSSEVISETDNHDSILRVDACTVGGGRERRMQEIQPV